MVMDLSDLIKELPEKRVLGLREVEVSSLSYDSRTVERGALFVALPGQRVDGHTFIPAALERGAVGVVVQEDRSNASNLDQSVPIVLVPDSRKALAQISAAFYRHPSASMTLVGITGTDGKTTTTFLTAALFEGAGRPSGLISTVAVKIKDNLIWNETGYTTPEAPEIQECLAKMREQGVQYAALETSSHSLALDRVAGCEYDVAVITNITRDHLDFHGTPEEYFNAKAKLFEMLHRQRAKSRDPVSVLNADDSSYEGLKRVAKGLVLTYGIHNPADIMARDISPNPAGSRFNIATPFGEMPVELTMPGDYNVYNCLAAISVALSQEAPLDSIGETLSKGVAVPGRMQRVDRGQPFQVIVDYAHAPNGLRQALSTLRRGLSGRLIVVFGCAGERDPGRRQGMGQVAGELADFSILTMDDPRSEDPNDIIEEIAAGLGAAGRREDKDYTRMPDRRAAIRHAFQLARPGDTVLLAGKGHEHRMLVGAEKLPWSDVDVAGELLDELSNQKEGLS